MDNKKTFQISLCAVICLVILRIAIGWHFFYEGLYKFKPRVTFSAESFLAVAKGPTAEFFYMLLPDLDGVQRLSIEHVVDEGEDAQSQRGGKKEVITFPQYEEAWEKWVIAFEYRYELEEDQVAQLENIHQQYLESLRIRAVEIEEDVDRYIASLDRFRDRIASGTNGAAHQQERDWTDMMKLRGEARAWLKELDEMGNGLRLGAWRLLDEDQQSIGQMLPIVTRSERAWLPNPCVPKQMRLLDYSVMCALTAIGFCLMIGLCTRLAAFGGACFLASVVLSQFPLANIYPPMPDMIGHFLFVSKDFIEMAALWVIMCMPVGRWAGLDFFLWNYCGKKFCCCKCGE